MRGPRLMLGQRSGQRAGLLSGPRAGLLSGLLACAQALAQTPAQPPGQATEQSGQPAPIEEKAQSPAPAQAGADAAASQAPAIAAPNEPEARFEARELLLDGEPLRFLWRPLAVAAPAADAQLVPDSALNTSWLLHRHLAEANIEEAAVLSNAPRRRHAELRRYLNDVGEAAFRKVFGEYFAEGNRPVAEAAIGPYRLIVWYLRGAERLAGEYYVEVDGRYMIDDGPSQTRNQLRVVLNSLRAGMLPAPLATPSQPAGAEPPPSAGTGGEGKPPEATPAQDTGGAPADIRAGKLPD